MLATARVHGSSNSINYNAVDFIIGISLSTDVRDLFYVSNPRKCYIITSDKLKLLIVKSYRLNYCYFPPHASVRLRLYFLFLHTFKRLQANGAHGFTRGQRRQVIDKYVKH